MDLLNGLVGYWPLDRQSYDQETHRFTDKSENGNHGIGNGDNLESTFDFAINQHNIGSSAIPLDGLSDFINCGDDASLKFGTGDFSLSCWFKSGVTQNGTLIGKGADGVGGVRYKISICDTGAIQVEIDDNGVGVGKVNIASADMTYGDDGSWHYAVGVKDGNSLRLYVDGIEDANSPADLTGMASLNTEHPAAIGRIYNAVVSYQFFNGLIAQVRIYNLSLSQDEITQLYLERKGVYEAIKVSKLLEAPIRISKERSLRV